MQIYVFLDNIRNGKSVCHNISRQYRQYTLEIYPIGVLKTVMHYGYSGISRKTNLLSEEIDLHISQETFLCSISDTIL